MKKNNSNIALGILAENHASNYLNSNNYQIIAKNWRWKKAEIDIIAKQNENLVIVEVKSRRSLHFGEPEYAVNRKKEGLLMDAAYNFALQHHLECSIQLDIISIIFSKENEYKLAHYKDVLPHEFITYS